MLGIRQIFQEASASSKSDDLQAQFENSEAQNTISSPNSAFEREKYFDQILENPDMEIYDNDQIALKLSDTGNEEAYQDLKARADTSGGELGYNTALERAVDKKMQRLDGSLSQNLSENAQEIKKEQEAGMADQYSNWSEADALTFDAPEDEDPALNMPEISYMLESEDPNVAVQALYFELAEMGIDPNDLDDAMKAGNDHDVLDALSQVAQDNGIGGLSQYAQDVQFAFADHGVPEAAPYAAPALDEARPNLAVSDPSFDQDNTRPKPMALGMA